MKRILLVGAGHAHLVLLRSLRGRPLPGAEVALVTPVPRQVYSGMLPGFVAGHYRRDEIQIDLAGLAERAGVELVLSEVASLDPSSKQVKLASGKDLPYDTLSLNVGSRPETPAHAVAVKPYEMFIEAVQRPRRVAVVGAGAGGVELAMALRHRGAAVTLYSAKSEFAPALGRRIASALVRTEVVLKGKTEVLDVEAGPAIVTAQGRAAFDLVLWTTGAAALPWLKSSGLATDERGFVLVDATLRSVSHPEVFATGDCATLQDAPHAKSGVYSVRHGGVLSGNLRNERQIQYRPQKHSLSIITCGAKYAIAERGGWTTEGAWVWRWKNWIDQRWMASLRFPP